MGVTTQRNRPVGIYIEGWNHTQNIAQRTERALRVFRHAVNLAIDLRLYIELLALHDDGVHGLRGILSRYSECGDWDERQQAAVNGNLGERQGREAAGHATKLV